MPHIMPFRGTFYNQEKIGNIFPVLAPPYDVISSEEQEELYSNHENNIIRIILGKDYPGDHAQQNRYTRAAEFLSSWQRDGILIRDAIPAIYLYEQEFNVKWVGKKVRRGFCALTKLEVYEQGNIIPHENTFPKPIADRYFLLKACRSNFNPVFALFPDQGNLLDTHFEKISLECPLIDFWDGNGMRNKVWPLRDLPAIREITQMIEKKKVFIADGHHRYETALKFRDEMSRDVLDPNRSFSHEYTMFYYTNIFSPGLMILPVHRIIRKVKHFSLQDFEEKLRDLFFFEPLTFNHEDSDRLGGVIKQCLAERKAHSFHSFVMYTGKRRFFLLTLKNDSILEGEIFLSLNPKYRKLDLVILHKLIIERMLQLPSQGDSGESIIYTPNEELAIDKVNKGECLLAFYVNPVHVDELIDLAETGLRLPHKATYFSPKLFSGLIINRLEW